MAIGTVYPSEVVACQDGDTHAQVMRVTGYRGNSNHLYFTNNSWYEDDTKIVIASDRDNRSNFFSVDLRTFALTQLTDLPQKPYPYDYKMLETFVDPVRNQCYMFVDQELWKIDLKTLASTVIYTMPKGFVHHIISCAADGDYVFTSIYEDLSARFEINTQHGYIGFQKIAAAKPLSRIIKINVDGSGSTCIREEKCWIAHVNVSPRNQGILTFCHEGPWQTVDHRIWGMNVATAEVWKIHPCGENEVVGHEYWYQDSEHIGYHGGVAGGKKVMGRVRFDNTEDEQTAFAYNTGHIFSLDRDLIVGDGDRDGKYVRLWKWNGEGYDQPRALCQHYSSFKTQNSHVHPRISPDGQSVLFTSDRDGYDQVYIAQIPDDVAALPLLSTLSGT